MTPVDFVRLVEVILLGVVGVLSAVLGFRQRTRAADKADVDRRLGELERRMERAGQETSNLSDAVQGMPERLRNIFVTQEHATFIWKEIGRLRDQYEAK